MRILITGSSGFIGSHLTHELEDAGHVVSGMDIKNDPDEDASDSGNVYTAIGRHNPDVVVHLARIVDPASGDDDVLETMRDHAGMTAVIAQACGDAGKRFVYASSGEVYGDNGNKTCDEINGPFQPNSIHGIGKRLGEAIGMLYAPDGFTALRFSMVYGPGAPAGVGGVSLINMLWQARHGSQILVHRGAERSWCWIGDAVRAARIAIERGVGPYNIARDDDPLSMWSIAGVACVLTGADSSLVEIVDPPHRQTVVKRLSATRIRQLGWEPTVEIYDGMKTTLETWVDYLDETGEYVPLRAVS